MLDDLLNNLLTTNLNINNANIDQIHLLSNLMQEYDKDNLFAGMDISAINSKSWKNEFLKKAQIIFYNSKKKIKKGVKSVSSKEFQKDINEEQKAL